MTFRTIITVLKAAAVMATAAGLAGAAGALIGIFFAPMDEYERAISDQEQMEYLQRWKDEH